MMNDDRLEIADATDKAGGIIWTEDLRLGTPSLDCEHQAITLIMARLHAAAGTAVTGEALGLILSDLVDQLQAHCLHEEQFMRANRCPGIAVQTAQHNQLFDLVQQILGDFERGGFQLDTTAPTTLWRWFRAHVVESDLRLKGWGEW
ncbi:MAG: hemerythrin family protein [Azospirillaceae bacterium]|nr:hemerythrin family protein [Azospirillaceae bacterium]